MRNYKVLFLVQAALIAALYVVLTLFANTLGLAIGPIQVRFSEALTILPFFTPAAIPGLWIGCVLANILIGSLPLDVVFGSLATLIGAVGTYYIGRKFRGRFKWFITLPPIIANTIIVPFILAYVYQFEGSLLFFMVTVGIGEIISVGVLGMILLTLLNQYGRSIFSPRPQQPL